jgi:hypothetical protein
MWLGSHAALASGLWLLATREPAAPPRRVYLGLIRAGACFEILRAIRGWIWNPPTFNGHWYILIATGVLAAVVTALVWTRLRRLAERASKRRLARWAALLSWLLPPVMVAQVVFFSMLPMTRLGAWMVSAHSVVGEAVALTGLVSGMLGGGSIGMSLLFWIPALALTLIALATLAGMTWLFFRQTAFTSAGGQRTPEEPQPVAAHDAGDIVIPEARGR